MQILVNNDIALFELQLQELKGVITKTETEYSDKIEEQSKQFKKSLAESEEKIKKLEAAKEKLEKSKEEAIQSLNEKIRWVSFCNKQFFSCSKQPLKQNTTVNVQNCEKAKIRTKFCPRKVQFSDV